MAMLNSQRIHIGSMLYMVTFTINIPQMLAYIPYMDPMGIYIYNTYTIAISMQELRGKELQAEVFQAKSEKRLGDPADFEAGANGGRSHW